jgi:hypothetical protein
MDREPDAVNRAPRQSVDRTLFSWRVITQYRPFVELLAGTDETTVIWQVTYAGLLVLRHLDACAAGGASDPARVASRTALR